MKVESADERDLDLDSDDEYEMRGTQMKETFVHYHKVYHDDTKTL